MPHQCTNCGHTFPDGSKEMLSGCPDCGGNKFQFTPDTGSASSGASGDDGPEPPGSTDSETGSDGVASRAADTVRGWVSSGSADGTTESTPPSESAAEAGPSASGPTEADSDAQQSPDRDGTGADWDRDRKPTVGRDEESGDDESFREWPDTARRPEDRSDSSSDRPTDADDRSAPSSASNAPATQSPGETTAPRSDVDGARDHETATMAESEDSAQASARSEIVPTDDLPSGSNAAESGDPITDVDPIEDGKRERTPENGRVVSEPSGEQPSIEELRAELNEQFESIKILRPGQYELNLMELYNRDEYIISLQEDGRYVIDVPESWHDDADE
ncbi:OapC/ArvC family zinc-ribbon domain-containing protein [Natronococcus occultus]|uniref:Zn-ribbon containing protein (DUF2072) n=1 Tax=Natronococcus occultus SP4 TaxID=694430 RepID=L0K419_9EURY|nr:Zn-ribbon containing protein [Natronococcus occultus]AGB39771.1 Zn-ribbon containing protein (DUF2072) [Natronococcus occultus SP4]